LAAVQTHYSPGGSGFGSGIQPYLAARQQNYVERCGAKKSETIIVYIVTKHRNAGMQ